MIARDVKSVNKFCEILIIICDFYFWLCELKDMGLLRANAAGDRSDIKIVWIIKHVVSDAIPLTAALPPTGIIEWLESMMHIWGWGLTDLHDFGVCVTGYDGVRYKTQFGLAILTAENFIP